MLPWSNEHFILQWGLWPHWCSMNSRLGQSKKPAWLWTFFSPPHWLSWSRLYEVDNDTFLPSAGMSEFVSDTKANAKLVWAIILSRQDELHVLLLSPFGIESHASSCIPLNGYWHRCPRYICHLIICIGLAHLGTSVWWPRISVFFYPYPTPSFISLSRLSALPLSHVFGWFSLVLGFGDRPAFYLLQEWAFPLSPLYSILLCLVFFFSFFFTWTLVRLFRSAR